MAQGITKQKTNKFPLTCDYFDSLKKENINKCINMNRGRLVDIQPEGHNKDLYKAAFEVFIKTDEGRLALAESGGKIKFEGWMIDLNDDGVKEAVLFPLGPLRGAAGNGDILIFESSTDKKLVKWKLIGVALGMILHIERSKTEHYYNFITYWHLGSQWSILRRYKMDRTVRYYKIAKEKELSCSAGSESPCF